jgi:hypothetical protein
MPRKREVLTVAELDYLREHIFYRLFALGDGEDSTAAVRSNERIREIATKAPDCRLLISKLSRMMFGG